MGVLPNIQAVLFSKKSTEAKKDWKTWKNTSKTPHKDTFYNIAQIPSKPTVRKPPVLDANTDRTKLEQETNLNFMLFNQNLFLKIDVVVHFIKILFNEKIFNRNFELNIYVVVCM